MAELLHRVPSVGAVTKKILAINPDLSTNEVIGIIRQSVKSKGGLPGEFATADVIDESLALKLAHATVQ